MLKTKSWLRKAIKKSFYGLALILKSLLFKGASLLTWKSLTEFFVEVTLILSVNPKL
jgi:hypothetical protein